MSQLPLVQGRDYYIENGYYVFTAYYLQNRGYCCGSGCRHCPYQEKNQDGTEVTDATKQNRKG